MKEEEPGLPMDTLEAVCSRRIGLLLARGTELARKAYDSGQYGMAYGCTMLQRVLVGFPLTLAHACLRPGDVESIGRAISVIEELSEMKERNPRHPHRGNWPR